MPPHNCQVSRFSKLIQLKMNPQSESERIPHQSNVLSCPVSLQFLSQHTHLPYQQTPGNSLHLNQANEWPDVSDLDHSRIPSFAGNLYFPVLAPQTSDETLWQTQITLQSLQWWFSKQPSQILPTLQSCKYGLSTFHLCSPACIRNCLRILLIIREIRIERCLHSIFRRLSLYNLLI